jgi:hypothetical protein
MMGTSGVFPEDEDCSTIQRTAQNLQAKLVQDLNPADRITQKRIEFLSAQLTDMNRARKMVPSIIFERRGVDVWKSVFEVPNKKTIRRPNANPLIAAPERSGFTAKNDKLKWCRA